MWVSLFKSATVQEPRWWRSRWTWNSSLSTGASGIHPQIEQLSQNTDWIPAGVLDCQKGLCRSMHDLAGMKGRREKDKTGQDQHPGAGELKRRRDSHIQRNWLGQKGSVWGYQRVNPLICDSLSRVRNTQPVHTMALYSVPQAGTHVHWSTRALGVGVWGLESNSRIKTTETSLPPYWRAS